MTDVIVPLKTLREAELELEVQQLRRKIDELTYKLPIFEYKPTHYQCFPPERVDNINDKIKTLFRTVTIESSFHPRGGLEVIGKSGTWPSLEVYYYCEHLNRLNLPHDIPEIMVRCHDNFIQCVMHAKLDQMKKGQHG